MKNFIKCLSCALCFIALIFVLYGCGQSTSTSTATSASTSTTNVQAASQLSTVEAQKVGEAVGMVLGIDNLLTSEAGKAGSMSVHSLSLRAQDITAVTREASGDWTGWWHINIIDTHEAENNRENLDAHARIWIVFPDQQVHELTQEAEFQYVDMDNDPLDSIPNSVREVSLAGTFISTSTSTRAADYYYDKIIAGAPNGIVNGSLMFVNLRNVTAGVGATPEIEANGQVSVYWQGPSDPLQNAIGVIFYQARVNLLTGYPEQGAPAYWLYASGVSGNTPNPILSGGIYFSGSNAAYIKIIAHGSDWESYYYVFNLDNGESEMILNNPPGPGPGTFPSMTWYNY
jgi:hypothetical protein